MRRFTSKYVHGLTSKEVTELGRCTMRHYGQMESELHRLVERKTTKARATIQRGTDGKVMGWALTFPSWGDWKDSGETTTYFYVRKEHRRRGVGRRLAEAVKKRHGRTEVSAWDEGSEAFFRKCGLE